MLPQLTHERRRDAVTLAVTALLCGLLVPLLRRNFSLEAMAIFLAISFGAAALIAIPWLLVGGRSVKHYLARAGLAGLLLFVVGAGLIGVADRIGEAGTGLMVIVNIGGVFGFLLIIVSLTLGLLRRNRQDL